MAEDVKPPADQPNPDAKPDTKNPLTPAVAPKVTLDEDEVAKFRDRAPDPDTSLDYSIQR